MSRRGGRGSVTRPQRDSLLRVAECRQLCELPISSGPQKSTDPQSLWHQIPSNGTNRSLVDRSPQNLKRVSRDVAYLAIIVFTIHVATASSGLFWLDSGDFVTASFVLGVPHATGFPLYTILGKLFCLLPIGHVAFRMCLLSAVLAAAVSALVLLLLRELGGSRWSTLVAALAASFALWATDVGSLAGRVPDVYALHIALLALSLLLLVKLTKAVTSARVGLLGFTVGLGMANHAEFRIFAVAILVSLLVILWRQRKPWTAMLLASLRWVGLAVVGMLPYLYLPIAANRASYHVWGQPNSIARLWDHFWGVGIQRAFGDEMLNASGPRFVWAVEQFFGQILSDFGVLLLLALAGAFVLARRWRGVFLMTLGLAVVDCLYAVVINPMGLGDLQNGATTYVVLAFWLGVATQWVAAAVAERRQWGDTLRGAILGAFLVTTALLSLVSMEAERRTFAGLWAAEDLVFEALQPAPVGALVLTDSEELAAARLYVVGVGCLRPDLQALNRHELFDAMLLAKRSREGPFELAADETVAEWANTPTGASDSTFHQRLDVVLERARRDGRTVLWEGGTASDSRGRWDQLELGFPLHVMGSQPVAAPQTVAWPEEPPTCLRHTGDPWFRRWASHYFTFLGTYFYHHEQWERAGTAFGTASEMATDRASPLVNLGVLAARSGLFERAVELVEEALERDPLNQTAWLNLARYVCVSGHRERALEAIDMATTLGASEERVEMIREFTATCPPR